MKFVSLFTFCLFWFIADIQGEYRSFELGLNPTGKKKIIEDMLGEDGKLYNLRTGTVFVVDKKETLDRIGSLLKDLEGQLPTQIRLSLRRALQAEKKKRNVDVGVKIDPSGGSVSIGLGDERTRTDKTVLTQLTTLSGERATLRLETTEGRLRFWRSYFLPTVEEVTSESEILEILPVLAGSRVRATVHSLYVVRVKGKKHTFKTGEVQSQVILPPGRWISLAGLMSEGEEAKRRNFGLSRAGESQWEDLKLEVKADIIKVDQVPAP
jgi:hypothetical protein